MAWTFLLNSAQFFRFKNWCKITSWKKIPWHQCWPALARGSNCHFFQKNAFFGQKKAFFQNVHFIQKCSVIQNTVLQYVKNNFLLSQKKFVFFTILNLYIRYKCPQRLEDIQYWTLVVSWRMEYFPHWKAVKTINNCSSFFCLNHMMNWTLWVHGIITLCEILGQWYMTWFKTILQKNHKLQHYQWEHFGFISRPAEAIALSRYNVKR